ncbi:hypothetical protein [[Clostridium] scindens]|uniref:hypothetical protein n=1 Tax=Clostridium scindens (strain JCM 10418 / VPI 12708) TaxID=29347 RepID=UPI002B2DDC68|nr:hypothetical protein PBLEJBOC_00401 [[Clostridium] scindens]
MKTLELKNSKLYLDGEEVTNMKHYSIYGTANGVAELNICMDVVIDGDSLEIKEPIKRDDYCKNLENSIRQTKKSCMIQTALLVVDFLYTIGLIVTLAFVI